MTAIGRPKIAQHKIRAPRISIRLTTEEAQIISKAVSLSAITRKTEWARKALIYVAQNGIRIT